MLYAIDDLTVRNKIDAKPDSIGFCPSCSQEMQPKCGEVNIWHWAHKVNHEENCDRWSEGETDWHLGWKQTVLDRDMVEVVKEKETLNSIFWHEKAEKHRADIIAKDGTVIELQRSPLAVNTIKEREAFYDKMLWVIPCPPSSLRLRQKDNYETFYWVYARRSFTYANKPLILDFDDPIPYMFVIRKLYADGGRSGSQCRGWGRRIRREKFIQAINNSNNFIADVLYNL